MPTIMKYVQDCGESAPRLGISNEMHHRVLKHKVFGNFPPGIATLKLGIEKRLGQPGKAMEIGRVQRLEPDPDPDARIPV